MREGKPKPKWKRALWLTLRAYAWLCTLLVTACLALVLWSSFFLNAQSGGNQIGVTHLTNASPVYPVSVTYDLPNRQPYDYAGQSVTSSLSPSRP